MRRICFYMNCTGVEGKLAKEKKLQHKKNQRTINFFLLKISPGEKQNRGQEKEGV